MNPLEMGTQPLDGVMERLGFKNSDLVNGSKEQLTFKMVAKGRKGRRLSLNVQMKILKALNQCQTQTVLPEAGRPLHEPSVAALL